METLKDRVKGAEIVSKGSGGRRSEEEQSERVEEYADEVLAMVSRFDKDVMGVSEEKSPDEAICPMRRG